MRRMCRIRDSLERAVVCDREREIGDTPELSSNRMPNANDAAACRMWERATGSRDVRLV